MKLGDSSGETANIQAISQPLSTSFTRNWIIRCFFFSLFIFVEFLIHMSIWSALLCKLFVYPDYVIGCFNITRVVSKVSFPIFFFLTRVTLNLNCEVKIERVWVSGNIVIFFYTSFGWCGWCLYGSNRGNSLALYRWLWSLCNNLVFTAKGVNAIQIHHELLSTYGCEVLLVQMVRRWQEKCCV